MVHRLYTHLTRLSAAAVLAGSGTAATAAHAPQTRLVACGAESCLLVAGRRPTPTSTVSINGHRVAIEGGRSWRVRLPLATVRNWSAPYARSLEVTVAQADGATETLETASLPIGLLGHVTDLAALVIRAH